MNEEEIKQWFESLSISNLLNIFSIGFKVLYSKLSYEGFGNNISIVGSMDTLNSSINLYCYKYNTETTEYGKHAIFTIL